MRWRPACSCCTAVACASGTAMPRAAAVEAAVMEALTEERESLLLLRASSTLSGLCELLLLSCSGKRGSELSSIK